MNDRMHHSCLPHRVLPCLLALLLGACVSSRPAPVETRDTSRTKAVAASSASASSAASAPVARPGYYIVKKGDTLYSIALDAGHGYREVAAWNGIENPAQISVGQELRVQPPEDAAAVTSSGTRPVILPRIESRPIDSSTPVAAPIATAATTQSGTAVTSGAASAPPPTGTGEVVTEPRGGRLPYSEKAWKDLQALAQALALGQSDPKAASAPVADTKPGVKPVVPPPATASAPVKSPDAAVKTGDDGVEWSWPSSGKVIGTFNDSSNKGIDVAGAIGDPVYAAASGKVMYSGSALRGYGNLVIIQHAAQFTSVYAHNKEILVKEGQTVQKGQKIAVVGDSDSDRPKLHFEVRKQGKPADPLKFLPTR